MECIPGAGQGRGEETLPPRGDSREGSLAPLSSDAESGIIMGRRKACRERQGGPLDPRLNGGVAAGSSCDKVEYAVLSAKENS